MTPKERAIELVTMFRPFADRGDADSDFIELESAKKCAAICVDEVIEEVTDYGNLDDKPDQLKFWNEVKKEINSL